MRFGIFWPGARPLLPSEKISALSPDVLDLQNHLALARACEDVALDFVLLGDGYAPSSEAGTRIGFQDPGLHALILAAPIIMATQHLGVISTLHTTFFHPAHIARFGANLDWLSGGRWGWNIVNGYRDYEASLFGFEQLPDSGAMYDAAEEAIAVIESLWDPTRRTEHSGANHRSRGKMKGPYPTERPVFVCAAASDRGRLFTATHCDFLFASPPLLSDVPGHPGRLGPACRRSQPAPLAGNPGRRRPAHPRGVGTGPGPFRRLDGKPRQRGRQAMDGTNRQAEERTEDAPQVPVLRRDGGRGRRPSH